jgi:hypothetical protein
MAVIPFLSKRKIDFSTEAVGQTNYPSRILADRVDVLHGRELTLECDVHEHSLANGGGLIYIEVWPQSRTPEEPGTQFEADNGPWGPAGVILLDSSTPSPAFRTAFVSTLGDNCVGALARVRAEGFRKSGVVGDPLYATISLRWSTKDTRTSFIPTQLPNCALWLHADDYNPSGNWVDRSTNFNTATQSTASQRPVLEGNFNGVSDVLFDGVDDNIRLDVIAGALGGSNTAFSVVYLFEIVSAPAGQHEVYSARAAGVNPLVTSSVSSGNYVCE